MPGCDPVQPNLLAIHSSDQQTIGEPGIDGVPALPIEVLSLSNPEHDLIVKRAAHARAGGPAYWMFRPHQRDVLVHHEPEPADGQYTQVARFPPDGEPVPPTLPVRAPVAALFANMPGSAFPAQGE